MEEMKKQKIKLIGENSSSFMIIAIIDTLKKSGYDVTFVNLDVRDLSTLTNGNEEEQLIVYAEETIAKSMDAIIYLRDYCVEHDKKIYLIGYTQEIETIKSIYSEKLVSAVFKRPLNVKELVEQLEKDRKEDQKIGGRKHILVVDDSGTMLRTIKSWLEPKYKVSMANSGAMAISFLANNYPDLILLDYEMPICSGPQLLEMIHAEASTASIPIIFLTAKNDIESVKKVVALKPAGYLLKSMDSTDIVKKIDEFFEQEALKKQKQML